MIRSLGLFLCPHCSIVKGSVPRIGMDSDQAIQHFLWDYVNDTAAHMEHARRLIFDLGRSVGGDLEILKRGSLILTRVLSFLITVMHKLSLTCPRMLTTANLV